MLKNIILITALSCVFASCNRKPDVSFIITSDLFSEKLEMCGDDGVKCAGEFFRRKAGKHCEDKKLSKEDCQKTKLLVDLEVLKIMKKRNEEMRENIEIIRKSNEEFKRKQD